MRRTWKKRLVFIIRKILISALAVLLCSGCRSGSTSAELTEITGDMSTSGEQDAEVLDREEDQKDTEREEQPQEICVHVCGAVVNPGVYQLPLGSRLYEAVAAAGGLREDAEDTSLNQASVVEDGQQIYVPTREEVASGAFGGANSESSGDSDAMAEGKVNINTADKEQLMTLRGIGESKAAAIIHYRETHGDFQSIEELMQIDGIKEGVFQKIRDMIKI